MDCITATTFFFVFPRISGIFVWTSKVGSGFVSGLHQTGCFMSRRRGSRHLLCLLQHPFALFISPAFGCNCRWPFFSLSLSEYVIFQQAAVGPWIPGNMVHGGWSSEVVFSCQQCKIMKMGFSHTVGLFAPHTQLCVNLFFFVFQQHCLYHGEVLGVDGSSVAVSTCAGLRYWHSMLTLKKLQKLAPKLASSVTHLHQITGLVVETRDRAARVDRRWLRQIVWQESVTLRGAG